MMAERIASFKISETKPIPIPIPEADKECRDLPELFSRMIKNDIRTKPSYTDFWLMNASDDLKVLAEYQTQYCCITVGDAPDGEMEYDIQPLEFSYSDGLNSIVLGIMERFRSEYRQNGGRLDRDSVIGIARGLVLDEIQSIEEMCPDTDIGMLVDDLCNIIYRYTVGAGVFEILLTDPRIEDVFLDAPCDSNRVYVTLNGIEGVNSHIRCRTNIMVENREVDNLINILKRESGLRFSQSNPVLETDFPDFEARATVVGFPMSPNGNAVAIRKHSIRPWTLSRLVYNGTIDPRSAGILSFLVENRCTFLICGPRGAGKSSLLSALMFEFPKEQRILTIEDTMELPGDSMRRLGYKIQSILVDDRLGGDQQSRSDEALRVSLRMGESAIVLGEVRGEEARTLYQSMRAGRAGSSIMGTIHGDSAESVYKRVVGDMGVSPDAFMATDIVITLGTVKDRRTGRLIRRVNEMKSTGSEPGEFMDIVDTESLLKSVVLKRAMRTSQLGRKDISKDIRARALMRSILAEAGRIDERYLGPEWILIANDILSKSTPEQTAESVAEQLRNRLEIKGAA
jgi:type IV secretory pathway ATPase VirB11/archaellum biosynthesis ATPase